MPSACLLLRFVAIVLTPGRHQKRIRCTQLGPAMTDAPETLDPPGALALVLRARNTWLWRTRQPQVTPQATAAVAAPGTRALTATRWRRLQAAQWATRCVCVPRA